MATDDLRRAIGKIISVAADLFVIEMKTATDNFTVVGFDDIHYVARIGTFVVIPVQASYVVAEVVGMREREWNSKSDDNGLSRTLSTKYLDVVPVGMLPQGVAGEFKFGVSTFPSLYADALYVLDSELDRIFDTADADEQVPDAPGMTRTKALTIGTSVVFQNYAVKVLVDEFFGGHSAVLGNTGSGKSCTVATILQSLFEKPTDYRAYGATFVVFDVNGEYTAAFSELPDNEIEVVTHVLDGGDSESCLRLPHWFLDQSEWELLLQASERTQVPVLRMALGLSGVLNTDDDCFNRVRKHVLASCVRSTFQLGDGAVAKRQRIASLLTMYGIDDLNEELLTKFGYSQQYGNFSGSNEQRFLEEVGSHIDGDIELPPYQNIPFAFSDLEQCLELALMYEEAHGNKQIRDYCSQLITRFKALRERKEYAFLRHSLADVAGAPTEVQFLRGVLGLTSSDPAKKTNQVLIVDMNAVEDEVVELVAAVIARMIFRMLRKRVDRNSFPVHLILEEAHRYISERPSQYSIDASKIFERIAKEGRKYGLFLQVASQRPSELSKTVLSQCSNFVVHRIQNPDDLHHIRQMTPFISDAVLKRLPSLPKQHALVFGNAVRLPATFRVRDAKPTPYSDDSKIRQIWFRPSSRPFVVPSN